MRSNAAATGRGRTAAPQTPAFAIGFRVLGGVAVLATVLSWSYWSTIRALISDWGSDPNYSVGQLVPLVAVYLVWQERKRLASCKIAPCWWGLLIILIGQAARFGGLVFFYESAERYSIVVTIAGVIMLVGGERLCWRLRWIVLFLLLMVPLPGRIHNAVSGPLQDYATSATVYVLEIFGFDVSRSGNVLSLAGDTTLGIAEACSGLRMLTAFVVVAAVLAFLVERPVWQRVTLVLSSVPTAIACNVLRLTATVILYRLSSSSTAEHFFHDFAGVTMMPAAIAILLGELWLLKTLVVGEPRKSDNPRGA